MDAFKWIVKKRMGAKRIESLGELSQLTGLGYQTMRAHIKHPEQMRLFELQALNEVLDFDATEIIEIVKRT